MEWKTENTIFPEEQIIRIEDTEEGVK